MISELGRKRLFAAFINKTSVAVTFDGNRHAARYSLSMDRNGEASFSPDSREIFAVASSSGLWPENERVMVMRFTRRCKKNRFDDFLNLCGPYIVEVGEPGLPERQQEAQASAN